MSIIGSVIYMKTALISKHRRSFIKSQGVNFAVSKFPTLGGRSIISPNVIHSHIYDNLISGKPFMVGRFGSIELATTGKEYFDVKYHMQKGIEELCNNAGFFPNDRELISEYSKTMVQSMHSCDVQGVWYLPFEDCFLKKEIPATTRITEARYLEPWYAEKPWTAALKGKKVLVIHPFVDTIKKQYENHRSQLFSNRDYLPEFQLLTLKAVQTIAGTKDSRFETWFDALDYMYKEAMKIEFDVAIIGCGAYGYPLAARIKESGKQSIHMGGVTQAMFGIKGKRWESDSNPIVRNLYNDYWVRPDSSEMPKQKEKVENGCYW